MCCLFEAIKDKKKGTSNSAVKNVVCSKFQIRARERIRGLSGPLSMMGFQDQQFRSLFSWPKNEFLIMVRYQYGDKNLVFTHFKALLHVTKGKCPDHSQLTNTNTCCNECILLPDCHKLRLQLVIVNPKVKRNNSFTRNSCEATIQTPASTLLLGG
jgi:hypothetical protein